MPTIVALKHQFNRLPETVRSHLEDLWPLLEAADLDMSLAYLFMVIEQGRYRSVKCILVRNLKCKTSIVDELLPSRTFSRGSFRSSIKSLIGVDIAKGDFRSLERAESVRDTIFHGRTATNEIKRSAIGNCLTFIDKFGSKVDDKTGKNPFATLQGLTSRIQPLNEVQSRWIMKGVFAVNGVDQLSENL